MTERVLSVTTAHCELSKAFVDVIFVDPETCMPQGLLLPDSVSLATFWLLDTVYVPVPPVPVPKEDIVVPEVTPVPVMVEPTASPPDVTPLTVSTVPAAVPAALAIDPVTVAVCGNNFSVVLVPFA